MTLPTAIAASCDTFFYQLGYDFYKRRRARATRSRPGRRSSGSAGARASTSAPSRPACCRRPSGAGAPSRAKTDPPTGRSTGSGSPATRSSSTIGQKDLLVTPLQMARFYALIANGGKLVQPHIVAGRRRGRRQRALARAHHPPLHAAPAAAGRARPHLPRGRPGRPHQATHACYGTSSGVFGNFPITIAGKTGTAEKLVPASPVTDRPVVVVRLRARRHGRAPELVVCALIENGGHGGDAAAPAALKVFEKFFHRHARPVGTGALGLMIEAVNTRARGLRTHRAERVELASRVRRLDWVLLGAVGALLGFGLWAIGGITAHDIPGNTELLLRAAGRLRGHRLRRPRRGAVRRPRLLPPLPAADLHRHRRRDAARAPRRHRLAPLEALARHRLLPLPAVRVREAALRPLPGGVPRRPGEADRGDPHGARDDRARLGPDPARVPPARRRHRDGLHRRARRGAVRRGRALAAHGAARRRDRRPAPCWCSGSCRRRACTC